MSSSRAEGTLITSPTEQQANAPVATTIDPKLMVAIASGDVQQLKDLVNEQKEDSKMMVVVMAKLASASLEKSHPQQENMDPCLLALASSGSSEKLQTLLNGENGQASGSGSTNGRLPTRRPSSYGDDTEANKSILEGVTVQGDTALHVVATCGYCNCDDSLEMARIIYEKAKHQLFVQNNNGDTPLHCAARAGQSSMVKWLIYLALDAEGEGRVKELLRIENKHKETALHEAVRVGSNDIVDLLMEKDSELASFPQDGGTSSMYLAIVLKRDEIVKTLYDKSSDGRLSFSGPNGQNALHAAVHRIQDLTKMLEWNKTYLCPQNKDLTAQRDEKGSTPLHFAATRNEPSSICQQILEANPDALYQSDHAGLFPIHVAASVGACSNVDMFIKRYPGSAGLRDSKGRTFLHVAVEKKDVDLTRGACRNPSLSWIMNIVDNDGNTALHLAVKAGSIRMVCSLVGNPQVNLDLLNSRGKTPLDIAEYKIVSKGGLYHKQSSEGQICYILGNVYAVMGVYRRDLFKDNLTVRVKADDESKEIEVVTGTLCIGSVLIATVTFGATFALPGGYIADDHSNGGSPILARRYAFDAFIASNTLAFVFSMMATIGVMQSGNPLFNPRSRIFYLGTAGNFVSLSIKCLVTAFALGAYVVLAPVAHKTAVGTCILSSLVMLYTNVEFIGRHRLLLLPLRTRRGLISAWAHLTFLFMLYLLFYYWPLILIFGWAAYVNPAPKI